MADLEQNKKPWNNPEIFSLDFNKTEGRDDFDFGEDSDYLPIDPSDGT